MTRSSFTRILLGGALAAAACSKPNPLFLDTWGVTDSGGTSEMSATSQTTPPTTPTTATASGVTDDPPTTTTATSSWTTLDPPTTESSDSEVSETTADPPCTPSEFELAPEHDTFLITKADAGNTCNLPMVDEFVGGLCTFLDFGQLGRLSSFSGPDMLEPSIDWLSAYVVRFPRDEQGRLVSPQGPTPLAELEKVDLWIAYSRPPNGDAVDSVTLKLFALPPGAPWVEGPGAGSVCTVGAEVATHYCRQCMGEDLMGKPITCPPEWTWYGGEFSLDSLIPLAEVEVPAPTPDGGTHHFSLDTKWFGADENEGFAVVATGVVAGGTPGAVDPGMIRLHAKEYTDAALRPTLKVQVCSP